MEKDIKLKYTDAALVQIEKFKNNQVQLLEDVIKEKKYFPGEDFIEITASDVQDVSKNFKYYKQQKLDIKYLIIYTYFLVGILTAIVGLFYEDIKYIYEHNRNQAVFVFAGLLMTFLSAILLFITKLKESRSKIVEIRALEEEIGQIHLSRIDKLNRILKEEEDKIKK